MYEFNFQNPGSVADAVAALKGAEDGKFMAGGQTLIPTLKQRLASPSDVIDLGKIGELQGISQEGDRLARHDLSDPQRRTHVADCRT
jgi:carbon-monoxide dehydrogenase medium subunit